MEEKYIVIHDFKDLEDDNYIYLKDVEGKNIYPREGLKPKAKRIKELSTDKNKIGEPLIQKIEKEDKEEIEDNKEDDKEIIEENKEDNEIVEENTVTE